MTLVYLHYIERKREYGKEMKVDPSINRDKHTAGLCIRCVFSFLATVWHKRIINNSFGLIRNICVSHYLDLSTADIFPVCLFNSVFSFCHSACASDSLLNVIGCFVPFSLFLSIYLAWNIDRWKQRPSTVMSIHCREKRKQKNVTIDCWNTEIIQFQYNYVCES